MGISKRQIFRNLLTLLITGVSLFDISMKCYGQCSPNALTQDYPNSQCTNCYQQVFIPSSTNTPCENYNGYALVFEDEFEGANLNTTKWHTCYPFGPNKSCRYTLHQNNVAENAVYSSNNAITANGKLLLKIEQVTANALCVESPQSNECNNGTTDPYLCNLSIDNLPNFRQFDYRSGMIYSKNKYPSGKFEIRCKIPNNDALWPAFWLWWGGWNDAYQEIDIFEFRKPNSNSAFSDYIKPELTIHRSPYLNQAFKSSGIEYSCGVDYTQNFHKFSVEWDKYFVAFFIDDLPIRYIYPLLNMAGQVVGGECDNTLASANYLRNRLMPIFTNMSIIAGSSVQFKNQGNYPVDFEIDYIKYWKKVDCNRSVNLCSWNPNIRPPGQTFADNTEDPTVYTGKEIFVAGTSCVISVDNEENLHLVATERVELNPGFAANAGSYFEAKISSCNTLVTFNKTDETLSNQNEENSFVYQDFYWFCYPNPAKSSLNLSVNIPSATSLDFSLTDVSGRVIKSLLTKTSFNMGEHNFIVSIGDLSNGIYFVNLVHGTKRETQRIVINN